jgi:hypothetical protein
MGSHNRPMERGLERAHDFMELPARELERLVGGTFPGSRLRAAQPLASGLRNTNYRLEIEGGPSPLVLRLYVPGLGVRLRRLQPDRFRDFPAPRGRSPTQIRRCLCRGLRRCRWQSPDRLAPLDASRRSPQLAATTGLDGRSRGPRTTPAGGGNRGRWRAAARVAWVPRRPPMLELGLQRRSHPARGAQSNR